MAALPGNFLLKWAAYSKALPGLNPYALGLGCLTAICLLIWPRGWKVPGSLAALVAVSMISGLAHLPVETIGSRFGGIPGGLPPFHWPHPTGQEAFTLLPSAFLIAGLAAIESLLCAVVADRLIDGHHKSNLELVAQGISNTASALFGGIPATGAIARTVTNVRNGGRTPVAGMIHAFVVLAVLLAAGPLAAKVPLACLAGILVVVCLHMFEWSAVRLALKGGRGDALVLVTTFLLTLFVNLTVAVVAGCALAALLSGLKKLRTPKG
jgi:SulP family sulfate permease